MKHIYYWQGKDSSQDERGTSALKAVELDEVGSRRARRSFVLPNWSGAPHRVCKAQPAV